MAGKLEGTMSKVSIIIPARKEEFLDRTVQDIKKKATGDIEVIVVENKELRPAINEAAAMAKGEYLMKIDAHCALGEGFDEILQKDCEDNWLVVPSKYSLLVNTWERFREPWNYFYLTFPYGPGMSFIGLHEKNYGPNINKIHQAIDIDDIITFQGSCWFLSKKLWDKIGPMDHEHYYYAHEAPELGLKTWLSGGRVVINKRTWYAHLFKGNAYKRKFSRERRKWERAIIWSTEYWMKQPGMKQLIEKFWPMPGWPDDWEDPKHRERFNENGYIKIPVG